MTNKPSIRINGFNDEWKCSTIGDEGDFYYGRSCPKWSVSPNAPTPCIRYGELYSKFGTKIDKVYSYTNMPPNKLRFSKGMEVLVPRVGEDPMDYNHCSWLSIPNVAIGEMISVYNTNHNPLFTATMFNATLQKDFAVRVEGFTVTNLYYEKLKNIGVHFPSANEQIALGKFFLNFDNLINLQQKKLDRLMLTKKAMLLKMFPQNGSTVPEVRFDGFAGAWDVYKFGDLYRKVREKNDLSYGTDKIISVANMYFKSDDKASNDEYMKTYNVFKVGDIAFEGNKSKHFAHGRFVENTIGDGIVSHVFEVFRPQVNYDLYFWKYAINSEELMGRILMRCTKSTTMMTSLVADDFFEETFLVPSVEEQKKIGDFFNNLDNLIALQEEKIEKLKRTKKALLAKMFV